MKFWVLPRFLGIALLAIIMLVVLVFHLVGVVNLVESATEIAFLIIGVAGALAVQLMVWPERFVKQKQPQTESVSPEGAKGLLVYTKAEVEQKFPFESFVSQVKHGGELIIVATSFAMGRRKTETIKRLIREQNVTVTLLLLAPFPLGRGTEKIESTFDWQGLTVEIEQTLVLLCRLKKELKELKERLIIRTYDRAPTLSLVVIDPETEDAIMQVGNYVSGTDTSCAFQVIVSKKTRRDVFDRYWSEYLTMRGKCSSPFNCKKVEHLMSS